MNAQTQQAKTPKQAPRTASADVASSTTTPEHVNGAANGAAAAVAPVAVAPVKAVVAPKVKTPEQQAAAKRREANELRRAAKTLGEDTDGGKSLLARALGLESDADQLAPRKSKSSEARPICAGTKKDGTACTAHAMEGSEFCTDHRPVRARFSDAEWAAFSTIPATVLIDRLGWGVALKMAKDQLTKGE